MESGLRSHYQQATSPKCIAVWESLGQVLQAAYVEEDEEFEEDTNAEEDDVPMEVDPDEEGDNDEAPTHFAGDLYGNEYDENEFPGWEEDPGFDDNGAEGDENEDDLSGDEDKFE